MTSFHDVVYHDDAANVAASTALAAKNRQLQLQLCNNNPVQYSSI